MIPNRTSRRSLIMLLSCVAFCYQGAQIVAQAPAKTAGVAFMTVEELKNKLTANEPVVVIDVRATDTYANSDKKIKGAVHLKVRKITQRLNFPPLKDVPRDRTVVTYCSCPADESAIAAARIFLENGFKNVRALKGGWREWVKISGPTEAKPRGM